MTPEAKAVLARARLLGLWTIKQRWTLAAHTDRWANNTEVLPGVWRDRQAGDYPYYWLDVDSEHYVAIKGAWRDTAPTA